MTLPAGADLPALSASSQGLESELLRSGEVRHVLADLGECDEARLDLEPRPRYAGDLTLLLTEGTAAETALAKLRARSTDADVQLHSRKVRTRLEELLNADEADLLIDLASDQRTGAASAADALLHPLAARPELREVARAEDHLVPTYRLRFRRDAMLRHGCDEGTLAAYLEAAAHGRRATALRSVNEEIPILLRTPVPESLEQLLAERVPTAHGLLPLGTFVAAELVDLPAALLRARQTPVVRLTADIAPGVGLAAAARAVRETLAAELPGSVRATVHGATEAFRSSLRAVGWSLALSLLLVYLILCAQFESLLQPLVVLAAVPLAAGGVIIALALTGQTLNLMSLTGCVVLVGIVVNDAIVKVDCINQCRRAGFPLNAAIRQAGRDRLRPILMTTVTSVLGLLPLALGIGEGSELRVPPAIAIVGGLTSATALTLFVVPVLSSFLGKKTVLAPPPTEDRSPTWELGWHPHSISK